MKVSLKELLIHILGVDFRYPVGSYYETSNANFDPNTAWGGTWVLDSKGRVTVGYDSSVTAFNQVGKTGGTRDAIVPYHRHSVAKVTTGGGTQHRHSFSMYKAGGFNHPSSGTTHTLYYAAAGTQTVYTSYESAHTHDVPAHNTDYEGTSGNATDANLQPYIVVNRWHRTA